MKVCATLPRTQVSSACTSCEGRCAHFLLAARGREALFGPQQTAGENRTTHQHCHGVIMRFVSKVTERTAQWECGREGTEGQGELFVQVRQHSITDVVHLGPCPAKAELAPAVLKDTGGLAWASGLGPVRPGLWCWETSPCVPR